MFEELLRRIPDWELVDPDEPQIMPGDVRPRLRPDPHPLHAEPLMATRHRAAAGRLVRGAAPGRGRCPRRGPRPRRGGSLGRDADRHGRDRTASTATSSIRVRPEPPGLLEPYDLQRQFTILRALEPTPVRSPRGVVVRAHGRGARSRLLRDGAAPRTRHTSGASPTRSPTTLRASGACARAWSSRSRPSTRSTCTRRGSRASSPTATTISTLELDHWGGEIERVKRGPAAGARAPRRAELRAATARAVPTRHAGARRHQARQLRVRRRRGQRRLRLGDGDGRRSRSPTSAGPR